MTNLLMACFFLYEIVSRTVANKFSKNRRSCLLRDNRTTKVILEKVQKDIASGKLVDMVQRYLTSYLISS